MSSLDVLGRTETIVLWFPAFEEPAVHGVHHSLIHEEGHPPPAFLISKAWNSTTNFPNWNFPLFSSLHKNYTICLISLCPPMHFTEIKHGLLFSPLLPFLFSTLMPKNHIHAIPAGAQLIHKNTFYIGPKCYYNHLSNEEIDAEIKILPPNHRNP